MDVPGTLKPITPDEWISTHGSMEATMSEMLQHNVTHDDAARQGAAIDALPWTMVEELVAADEGSESTARSCVWNVMRPVMALVAVVSLVSPYIRAWTGASDKLDYKLDRLLV